MRPAGLLYLLLPLIGLSFACSSPESSEAAAEEAPPVAPAAEVRGRAVGEITRADVPASMRSCWTCHRPIVESYLGHGMAASVGPVGEPPLGSVTNSRSGNRYDFSTGGWLDASLGNGGRRRQKVVGRIGAGIYDVSWVTEEVDLGTGAATGRLFFAPAETVTGHGLKLSPFENHEGAPGLDLSLTQDCLTCHSRSDLSALPEAGSGPSGAVFPRNLLGGGAFEQLEALSCSACHGDASRHLELVSGTAEGEPGEIGISRLGSLPAGTQLDVCARCHLQGDARLELVPKPDPKAPLLSQWPVLVPAPQTKDYRFVSQLERLALSPCFRKSPQMTCSTCHEPHVGVAQQGLASFEATCQQCHLMCSRDPELKVAEVTGRRARSEAGCVDCHVRRSQPFDLPHIESVDHWIRRRIPLPEELPHRQFADPKGVLQLFADPQLREGLATAGGRRWKAGVEAIGLMTLGRFEAAASGFDAFPPPGTPGAVKASAPQGWASLESSGIFHEMRAVSLQARGDLAGALAAYSDALAVEPGRAGARLGRARLSLAAGNLLGVVQDTQVLIDEHPRSEAPWDLRASMALRLGRPDMAVVALTRSTGLWPSNPHAWLQLAQALEAQGQASEAAQARERARLLDPELAAAHAAASGSPGG